MMRMNLVDVGKREGEKVCDGKDELKVQLWELRLCTRPISEKIVT